MGVLFCALSVFSNTVERIVKPVLRPLFWVSGIFFASNELPSHVREIFLWNPVLHVVEITRGGLFVSYDPIGVSWTYPAIYILAFAVIGLTVERVARRQLEVT